MHPLRTRFLAIFCLPVVLLLAPLVHPASAQEKPAPAVELAAGALLFSDDAVVAEGFVGGSGRVYLTPRSASARRSPTSAVTTIATSS